MCIKKFVSMVLTLVITFSMVSDIRVLAADDLSYPPASSGKYIEFKAQEKIYVYKDNSCKIRGTSNPAKSYDAYISKNDVCYIYKITSSYIEVNYPTGSGRRTGYIKRSSLFDKTSVEEYISSAKASVTVHKADGNSSIAIGDKVWRVDPKNGYSGYRAVIYEAKKGARAYKMGYITLDDLSRIRKADSPDNTQQPPATDITYAQYTGVDYTLLTSNRKRIAALDKAKRMVTVQWTAPCDFVTWASKKGILNSTTSINGYTDTKFKKGQTYTGIPYSMNSSGSRTLDDAAWMKLLGNGISTSMMQGNYYPKNAGTKYGIDCSAFVCEAYEAATGNNLKLNTDGMIKSKCFIKLNSFSQMKPGDVFLKSGHVMMYVGMSGGEYAVFEASAGGSKCRYKTYSTKELSEYKAYKYTGFED